MELAPLIAEGGTDLYPPLADGLDRLGELDMKERHVLIISDGKTREGDFQGLLRRARLRDITISAIAVGEEVNAELLARIAQGTSGRYYRVLHLDEIPSIIFEDRREVARSSFARDQFAITAPGGTAMGRVDGMSLFTPKPGRPVLLRNQFDDPLLLVERRKQQFLGLFLSDLYGTYTAGLFSNPQAVDLFRGLLEPVLRPYQLTVRYAEAAPRARPDRERGGPGGAAPGAVRRQPGGGGEAPRAQGPSAPGTPSCRWPLPGPTRRCCTARGCPACGSRSITMG